MGRVEGRIGRQLCIGQVWRRKGDGALLCVKMVWRKDAKCMGDYVYYEDTGNELVRKEATATISFWSLAREWEQIGAS